MGERKTELSRMYEIHDLLSFTGMIGALPPGAMHPAFAAPMGFPGAPMLAPMMHPRFR